MGSLSRRDWEKIHFNNLLDSLNQKGRDKLKKYIDKNFYENIPNPEYGETFKEAKAAYKKHKAIKKAYHTRRVIKQKFRA